MLLSAERQLLFFCNSSDNLDCCFHPGPRTWIINAFLSKFNCSNVVTLAAWLQVFFVAVQRDN